MKFTLYEKRLSHLNVQRKFLLGLSSVLLMVVFLQSVFLFSKRERVIITPPELTQSYWVQGSAFSKSYLEEMALFFSHLLLDVSQDSILSQGEVVLRYVVPNSYGVFKSKLLEDEQRLKKHQLSLHFIPKSVAFVQPLTVEVQGYLNHYVGSQRVSQVQETYRIDFSQKKSQLFLESFRVVKSEQGNLQDANL